MNYINIKSNYVPIAVTREESEAILQTPPEQPETNTGIANTPDIFEAACPVELTQQQTLPQGNVELSPPSDQSLEASTMFDFVSGVLEPEPKDMASRLADAISEGKKANDAMQRALKNSQDIRKDD